MKNAYKSFALLCMGLAAVACMEEQFEDDKPNRKPIAENEIIFSASASVETGNKQTKTAYGKIDADDKEDGSGQVGTVLINWKHNDPIMIASPHTSGTTHAKYLVNLGDGADENSVAPTAVSLDRQGDVGLQWSGRNKPYQFWAMYPSPDTFADVENPVSVDVENESIVMKGRLPVDKRYTTIPAAVNGRYEFAPDMMYAYMVANDTYQYGSEDDAISLKFTSLVTAMQFELQTGTITADQANSEIIVSQIVLFSAGNQKLTGEFTYKFDGVENCSEGTSTYASVTFDNVNQNNKPNGLILTEGNICDVTFFMLPSYKYTSGDLQLKIVYYYDGVPQTKTATIGSVINPTKKYHFKGVQLPDITRIDPSSWFDVLDPSTPVAQLSIPTAGNAYSYAYTAGSNSGDEDDPRYFKQQIKTPSQLWNLGVRGFEFKTSFTKNGNTYNVKDNKFVCNGVATGTYTFDSAFKELYELLKSNPTETLVLICTYQSHGGDPSGGYNPQGYITAIETYLSGFCTENNITKPSDLFTKLTTASKVRDIRGKICLILRVGDYDYVRWDRNNNYDGNWLFGYNSHSVINYEVTAIKVSQTWSNLITLVDNWGTAVDQWDKRFGNTYFTAGAFNYSASTNVVDADEYSDDDNASSRQQFETRITRSSSSTNTALPSFPEAAPFWTASINQDANQRAYVQAWERIVPVGKQWKTKDHYGSNTGSLRDAYYSWPETLSEKKNAILSTLDAARDTVNHKGLHINSICGYFMTEDIEESVYPYMSSVSSYYLPNAGKGGDYASCAAELNCFLYNELKTSTKIGPLGVIMLDYIGAESSNFKNGQSSLLNNVSNTTTIDLAVEACKALPGLILMNNFKVKPTTGGGNSGTTTPTTRTYDATYVNGGEAISFE